MVEDRNLLELHNAVAGYGAKDVLRGIDIEVRAGEITAIIGPNGAGKSTVLKVVSGLLRLRRGSVSYEGAPVGELSTAERVRSGIVLCLQGNRVFDDLTVVDNLRLGGAHLEAKDVREAMNVVLDLFPTIRRRLQQRAGTLSGGEQQMVAVARSLVAMPKLLLVDEPSLGLAPGIVDDVLCKITEINRAQGVAVVIVEQKVKKVLGIAHRVYAMKEGVVKYNGSAEELRRAPERLKELFL